MNASWSDRISQYLQRASSAGGVPDDLTATLGSFNFYAAVRYAYFELSGKVAVVTDIVIYVRDSYEFSDDQYLGHESKSCGSGASTSTWRRVRMAKLPCSRRKCV